MPEKKLLDEVNLLDSLSANDRWNEFGRNLEMLEDKLRENKTIDLQSLKRIRTKVRIIEARITLEKQSIEKEIKEIGRKRNLTKKYKT